MKVGPDCYLCIKKLIYGASDLSTDNEELLRQAREEVLNILETEYSNDTVPAQLSTKILRTLKNITGNPNPFRERKRQEIDFAREFCFQRNPRKDLKSLVEFSALGNTLDFFKKPGALLEVADRFPGFAQEDISRMADKLDTARKILFLADNAGECFFDKPLVMFLAENTQVTYVVKSSAVQNDMTYEDLEYAGLADEMGRVLVTGDDAVGIDPTTASERMIWELRTSDIVVAKGMGHYETLSELPIRNRIFHILMAKCAPVASSLQTYLNGYLAILR